jgi:hypothetical protein
VRRKSARGESAVPDIDALQAKLFFLVSRYGLRPSPAIADRVVAQLDALGRHPCIELLPVQQRVYASLMNLWRSRASSAS